MFTHNKHGFNWKIYSLHFSSCNITSIALSVLRWIHNNMLKEHSMLRFYSSVATHCDMRPNHLVCPSGRNTMQAEANTTQEKALCSLEHIL